ncbi:hypothetical protein ACHWQZ_G017322 [Mnemiopsis leidyi]
MNVKCSDMNLKILPFWMVLSLSVSEEMSGIFIMNADETVGYIKIGSVWDPLELVKDSTEATRFDIVAGLDNSCTDSISIRSQVEDVYIRVSDDKLLDGQMMATDIADLSTLTSKTDASFQKVPVFSTEGLYYSFASCKLLGLSITWDSDVKKYY